MTEPLFRDDAYLRAAPATVIAVTPEGGIVLDRTVFYAQGGGQPGDVGRLLRQDGSAIQVANAVYGPDRASIVHVPAPDQAPLRVGEQVTAELVQRILGEEMGAILESVGADAFDSGRFEDARRIFSEVALSDSYDDFLTLPAYDTVVEAGS